MLTLRSEGIRFFLPSISLNDSVRMGLRQKIRTETSAELEGEGQDDLGRLFI